MHTLISPPPFSSLLQVCSSGPVQRKQPELCRENSNCSLTEDNTHRIREENGADEARAGEVQQYIKLILTAPSLFEFHLAAFRFITLALEGEGILIQRSVSGAQNRLLPVEFSAHITSIFITF